MRRFVIDLVTATLLVLPLLVRMLPRPSGVIIWWIWPVVVAVPHALAARWFLPASRYGLLVTEWVALIVIYYLVFCGQMLAADHSVPYIAPLGGFLFLLFVPALVLSTIVHAAVYFVVSSSGGKSAV